MVDEFRTRRDLVLDMIKGIDGIVVNKPSGAFYVFPEVSSFFGKTIDGFSINNATDFSLFLLEKANVATVTGDAFGAPGYIRISYAASTEQLKEAFKRIKEVLEK
jgi:aspartate aminotransferase